MNRLLALLLITFLAVGVVYALATPPFEASDEVFHYPFVRHVALGKGLPVQNAAVKQPWEQVGSHPPLYYYISAALTFWIDTSDFDSLRAANPFARIGIPGAPQNVNYTRAAARFVAQPFVWRGSSLAIMILRGVSLLMGAGTVALTYFLASRLQAQPTTSTRAAPTTSSPQTGFEIFPLLSAALVAFNPEFVFISASVNNDNLLWFEAVLTLFIVAHIVRGASPLLKREFGTGRWDALGLGLLLGCAALTKISGLWLIPITGLALLAQAARTRNWRGFFVNGTMIVAAAVAVSGWWYVRNQILYGELLALKSHASITATRLEPYTLATFIAEFPSFWYSYWGMFGSFNILAARWVYTFFTALTVVGIAGGLKLLVGLRREGAGIDRWLVACYALLAFFVIATAVSLLQWNFFSYAAQGRLMFTTLAPVSIFLAAGLLAWIPRRWARAAVGGLVAALGLIAIFCATTVAAAYLPPAPIAESQLPDTLRPVMAALAPGAELIGYTADSGERIAPGGKLIVTLYWRALAAMPTDYNLFLHALGRARALAGSVDTWPGGGLRPTSFWKTGKIYKDTYVIDLDPAAAAPSTLWLDAAMWQTDSTQPLPITDAGGRSIPSVIVPVGWLDSTEPLAVNPQTPADSTLEGGLSLLGFDLPSTITAGTPSTLTLYWQAADTLTADYTVFIHVRDAAGNLIAQADSPPLNGDWPTSAWQLNRPVIDPHTLTIPSPGEYSIRLGMYDPSTVIPLIALRADGSEWPDRAIELAKIVVR